MDNESSDGNESDREVHDTSSDSRANEYSTDGTEDEFLLSDKRSDTESSEPENVDEEDEVDNENGSDDGKPKTPPLKGSEQNQVSKKVLKSEVRDWIDSEMLELRDPPPAKANRLTAKAWTKKIMKFLYWTQTGEEFTNWYACSECDYLSEGPLQRGTSGIKEHCEKHLSDVYEFDKKDLASTIYNALLFGKNIGSVPLKELEELLPEPDQWYLRNFVRIFIIFPIKLFTYYYRSKGKQGFWNGLLDAKNRTSDGNETEAMSGEKSTKQVVVSKQSKAIEKARAAMLNTKSNAKKPIENSTVAKSLAFQNVDKKSKSDAKSQKRAELTKRFAKTADLDLTRAKNIVNIVASGKVQTNRSMPKQAKEKMLMNALPPMPKKAKKRAAESLLKIDISLDSVFVMK